MTHCRSCLCHTITATGEIAADMYDLTVVGDDGCALQEIRVIEVRDERKIMNTKQIEASVRKSLKRVFPDTVFQVTFHNGTVDCSAIGGKMYDGRYTDSQVINMMVDAIRETLPDYMPGVPEYDDYRSSKIHNSER